MPLFALLQLLLGTATAAAGAHPDSLSISRVKIDGSNARVELRFQGLSLLEVHPEFDRSQDGLLEPSEVTTSWAEIEAYLLASFRLARREGDEVGAAAPLVGKLVSLVPEDPARLGAFELQHLDARLDFTAPRPLEALVVEVRLFHAANPWHKDLCSLTWNEDEPVSNTFTGSEPRWLFEPEHVRRPSVLASFVRLGITHILGTPSHPLAGSDHLAFLLALLVASRRVRTLVGVVTAFTVAHSLTLAAAALGWVDVPSNFVELAIALSIAYVACDNLLRKSPRNPWLEAFFFGLLHGLGFAGFLEDALVGETLFLTALLGFNVGVELGQLAFVFVCVLVVALLFRAHRRHAQGDPDAGLAPPWVRTLVSIAVALAGFYWFFERAGWLSWG